MAITPAAALVLLLQITYSTAYSGNQGLVVTAPHGGYDSYASTIALRIRSETGWGLVRAEDYRSYSAHRWYDVNRPTQRPWTGGGFGDDRWTSSASSVYEEYQRKILLAARVTQGPVKMLAEIHGHSRAARLGASTVDIDVIELATNGFTYSELVRLKARYARLVQELPFYQRVDLAIDRLDDPYVFGGYYIPFYLFANGCKSEGSMRSSKAERALHFELPRAIRFSSSARTAYARLLGKLLEETYEDVR